MDHPVPDTRAWISLPFWEIRGRVGALLSDMRALRKTAARLANIVSLTRTPQGLYALLHMCLALGDEHETVETARRLLEKHFPDSVEFFLAMGEEAELRDDHIGAHAAYTEAARIHPDKHMEEYLKDFFDRWGGQLSGREGPSKWREQPAMVYSLREDDPQTTTTPVPIPRTP